MADTAGDVTGGGEDRPSSGGVGEEDRVALALQVLVSRLKDLSGVDWTKGEPVATLYGDKERGNIVREMVSRMGSPSIDGAQLRGWLNGSLPPLFGVRSAKPYKGPLSKGVQRLRAVTPLRNAISDLDRRKAELAAAEQEVRKAQERVSAATLLDRAIAEYDFLSEVAETAKPLFSLGVGWAFLKCLAMRDTLVPKDPEDPGAEHDYDPADDVDGPYAYGYRDMFDRVRNEGLGDEVRVIQVVMHHARNDRFFQATVKQELFSICVRRYAEALADYRGLPAGHVHGVSPDIGDNEVIRVLTEAMRDLPSAAANASGGEVEPKLV